MALPIVRKDFAVAGVWSRFRRLLRRWLVAVGVWLSLLVPGSAQAITVALTATALQLSPGGPYASARDKPIGTQIASATTTILVNGVNGSCSVTTAFLSNSPASGNSFMTGVAGLGVNLYYTNGANRVQITPQITASLLALVTAPGTLTTLEADLVVTGPIGSGQLATLPNLNLTFGAVGTGCGVVNLSNRSLAVTAVNGEVSAVTCAPTNTAISVTLPSVSVQSLASTGATTGSTSFAVILNCSSVGAGVYITLTDAANAANTTSQLSLGSSATATNVKLQILNSTGVPVSYGPAAANAGTANQFYVGPSASATSLPLAVRYIATGAATAGSVNAAATFTLSYQ